MTQRNVLRWVVPVDDQDHPIGIGRIVHVDTKGDPSTVHVWTEEIGQPELTGARVARVFGTGQPIPDSYKHHGSCLALNGDLVWHVYDRWPPGYGWTQAAQETS